jgi:D-glycero-alpha-D-manno-heptose-7-phosphate kinase
MLFYTGIVRTASDVAGTFVAAIGEKRRQLRVMRDLVDEALAVLGSGRDLRPFGELLHEAWELKRGLSRHVTNDRVDEQYHAAREAGAIGGKITGAGGGGFMLLFVPVERQRAVRERLGRLLSVPFQFESAGSQIIFVDHEEDYAALDEHRKAQSIDAFTELALEPSR